MQFLDGSSNGIEEFSPLEERKLKQEYNPMFRQETIDVFVTMFSKSSAADFAASGKGRTAKLPVMMAAGVYPSTSSDRGVIQTTDFSKTMRHEIRNINDTNIVADAYTSLDRDVNQITNFNTVDFGRKPKQSSCLPKFGLFLALGLAILGGIVAGIVFLRNKDAKDFGEITDDPVDYRICPDQNVQLDQPFEIACEFNETHLHYKGLSQSTSADVMAPDRKIYGLENTGTNVNKRLWRNQTSLPQLKCPMAGVWTLLVYLTNTYTYRTSFRVDIQAPTLQAQNISSKIGRCSISGGCGNFVIKFVDNSTDVSLDSMKTCVGQSSNQLGTNLTCDVTLTDESIDMSHVKCELYNDRAKKIQETFIPE